MKWGGEGLQAWEDERGSQTRPNVQRALEDCHCTSKEEQGQKEKHCSLAKWNGENEDWSKGDAEKGKKERDSWNVKDIGLELRTKKMVAKGRKFTESQAKKWEYSEHYCMAYIRPKTRTQIPSKTATKISWADWRKKFGRRCLKV